MCAIQLSHYCTSPLKFFFLLNLYKFLPALNNMCILFCNVQVAYMILLVVFSQLEDSKHKHCDKDHQHNPDHLVVYFCIGHAVLWLCITVLDRIIQWRHQIIRKRGYLTFYRKMRNIRRVPFVLVSTSEQ